MDFAKRTVTETPLGELWIEDVQIDVNRSSYLTRVDIKNILKLHPVTFVVANVGEPLKWVKPSESYGFWKGEVEGHIADNIDKIDLEYFTDNYAYIASKWIGKKHDAIILLEKVH